MKWLAALSLAFLCFNYSYAHSCSSSQYLNDKDFKKELDSLHSIFFGEVTSVEIKSPYVQQLRVKVLRFWKDPKVGEIDVEYHHPCGTTHFEIGQKFMFYVWADKNGRLLENCCSPAFFEEKRVKSLLGDGTLLEVPPQPQPEEPKGFWSSVWEKILSFFS